CGTAHASHRSSRGPASTLFCAAAVSRIHLSLVPPDIPPNSTDTQALFIHDQLTRPFDVALAHQGAFAEPALPLRRFVFEQMVFESSVALDLARTGLVEPLGRSSTRLHLRHGVSSSRLLFRTQNHDHLPPFQAGMALHFTVLLHFFGHPV